MTKLIIIYCILLVGDWLKRTPNIMILRGSTQDKNGDWLPIPKGIRCKNLRYLCGLNALFLFHNDVDVPDLRDNPKGSVEYIMKKIHVTQRTAYDYYTTLLYLNHLNDALITLYKRKEMEKEKTEFEKKGLIYPLTIPEDEWF